MMGTLVVKQLRANKQILQTIKLENKEESQLVLED